MSIIKSTNIVITFIQVLSIDFSFGNNIYIKKIYKVDTYDYQIHMRIIADYFCTYQY